MPPLLANPFRRKCLGQRGYGLKVKWFHHAGGGGMGGGGGGRWFQLLPSCKRACADCEITIRGSWDSIPLASASSNRHFQTTPPPAKPAKPAKLPVIPSFAGFAGFADSMVLISRRLFVAGPPEFRSGALHLHASPWSGPVGPGNPQPAIRRGPWCSRVAVPSLAR